MARKTPKEKPKRNHPIHTDGMTIAINFKRLRVEAGYPTQPALAKAFGVTAGYIGQLESGKASFGTEAQEKWARRFGVSRHELLKPLDIGVQVQGGIMKKGLVVPPPDEQADLEYVELPPGYTQRQANREGIYGLRVITDTLYPFLRQNWVLYVAQASTADIRPDDLVIFTEDDGTRVIKEVEAQDQGRLVLRSMPRGRKIAISKEDYPTMEVIFYIARPRP